MDFFSFFLSGCYRPELWRLRCKMNVPVPPPYQGQPDSSRGGWSDPGSSNHMRCSSHGQGLLSLNFYIQGVFFLQLFLLIITANVKTSCSQLELLLQIKISIKKTPRLLSDFFLFWHWKLGGAVEIVKVCYFETWAGALLITRPSAMPLLSSSSRFSYV